mgnify:CR=1 FL=1
MAEWLLTSIGGGLELSTGLSRLLPNKLNVSSRRSWKRFRILDTFEATFKSSIPSSTLTPAKKKSVNGVLDLFFTYWKSHWQIRCSFSNNLT